jgi:hypothetical protein
MLKISVIVCIEKTLGMNIGIACRTPPQHLHIALAPVAAVHIGKEYGINS